jgi:hypothetical protein
VSKNKKLIIFAVLSVIVLFLGTFCVFRNIYNEIQRFRYDVIYQKDDFKTKKDSFAAEVEFHADAVYDWKSEFNIWYEAAIRADMAIGEEAESGFYNEYYDLDSDIVIAQANEHGEY